VNPELIGWASSLILLATLAVQTAKLYRSESNRGVSKWLFIGELAASSGFTVYSALLHNRVYLVANALGAVTAVIGLVIYFRNRRRSSHSEATRMAASGASTENR
jgi:MtN3 and saliva related transmembrane protein